MEHVTAYSQGGLTVYENLVMACEPCNYARASMDAYEFAEAPFHHWSLKCWRKMNNRSKEEVKVIRVLADMKNVTDVENVISYEFKRR